MESSTSKSDKPLSIDKAAFLLLRVRRVFKKKIALKKEKNLVHHEIIFPKGENVSSFRKKGRSGVPPLIRSRTVPAIIVPFSILQAQLVKAGGGCAGANPMSPTTSQPQPPMTKSDFSTPGVDFVQFLTGPGSPSSSVAGTPPAKRNSHVLGLSNSSICRELPNSDSFWNISSGASTSNVSPSNADSIHGQSSAKGLSRFARLLNTQLPRQSPSPGNNSAQNFNSSGIDVAFALATPRLPRRRRSLENEDISGCRPRAVSIDSLVRSNFLAPPSEAGKPKRYSASSGPNYGQRQENKFNEGFIAAVELGNVGKVKNFLESTDIDINSLTADGLTLLDVAVIQRNRQMVKLLLSHGATENQYWRKESISDLLNSKLQEAEKKSEDLMSRILKCSTFGNMSPAQLKELEKEFQMWERCYKKFRKMRLEYTQIRPPDVPIRATVDVIGPNSVKIKIVEDEEDGNSICTKYKIEWSTKEEFNELDSCRVLEVFDLKKMETVLNDLKSGIRYYFRVSCGNCTGYGLPRTCSPNSVIPSSWRDVECGKNGGRYVGKSHIFDDIFKQIRSTRPQLHSSSDSHHKTDSSYSSCTNLNPVTYGGPTYPVPMPQPKKNQKIISIKQLFSSAPKFIKNFKRGIFLSCVIYSEDKLLVTAEEFLPTIEIDESFPSTLHTDFHWLLKVACTWEDVKSLKHDMEKSGSASTFHFRLKLLQAAAAMQSALGMSDLGRLYYKTIREKSNSVVVFSTINYMRSTKLISSLNVRWAPIAKMSTRKYTDDISDLLMSSIQEQILYHQVSNIPLGRGLYLSYLKLASSVDLLKIIVTEKTPNVLPHAKIRDNAHVSSEEWGLIASGSSRPNKSPESLNNNLNVETNNNSPTEEEEVNMNNGSCKKNENRETESSEETEMSEAQTLFKSQLNSAIRRLFSFLEIEHEDSLAHRLYNSEVVEVNSSVSFIVIFPAVENVCLVAGQSDKLTQRNDLIPLPIQVFEMIHLSTYQKDFITRYARLSAILEVETVLAQHNQREAFSSDELSVAKERLVQLSDLQTRLDSNWRGSRWVIDLVTSSRDRASFGIPIKNLLLSSTTSNNAENLIQSSSDSVHTSVFLQSEPLHSPSHLNLHSKSDQSLRFGSNLSNLKFSRSENQLSLSSSSSSPSKSIIRKTSIPLRGEKEGGGEGDKFLVTTHSQSDSTISTSLLGGGGEGGGLSTSLHNLYREEKRGGISLGLGAALMLKNMEKEEKREREKTGLSPKKMPRVSLSRSGQVTGGGTHKKRTPMLVKGEPPPVPPRRSLPPPSVPRVCISPAPELIIKNGPISQISPPPEEQTPLPPPPPPHQSERRVSKLTHGGSYGSLLQNVSAPPPEHSPLSRGASYGSLTQGGSGIELGVIQVYAAYECGLSVGTSVKLRICPDTTAGSVTELVVKQLEAQSRAKCGNKNNIEQRPSDYCLVAVVGARERCLRVDFRPMSLQSPWREGRLFVRRKSDVTAAISMSNREDLSYL